MTRDRILPRMVKDEGPPRAEVDDDPMVSGEPGSESSSPAVAALLRPRLCKEVLEPAEERATAAPDANASPAKSEAPPAMSDDKDKSDMTR